MQHKIKFILSYLILIVGSFVKIFRSLILRVQLTIISIGTGYGLAPHRRQAITWTNDGLVYWHLVTRPHCVNSLRPGDAYMISKLTIICSDNGLSPGRGPSHYLNQCWNIVNWSFGNKLQWNLNRNRYIFIHENPFENGVWKMAAILSQPQCVNHW